MINLGIADLLLFSVVNAMNILTFFIFVSRVKWPNIVHKLAIATILLAIPAIVVAFLNKTAGCEWLYWAMPIVFVAWPVLAVVVDHLLSRIAHCLRNLLTLGEITIWQYACSGCREKYSRW